jgi:hypothetical protein
MRYPGLGATLALCATLAAGCSSSAGASPSASAAIPLSVANSTTIAVTIVVNGETVATVQPGSQADITAGLPPLPWDVESRSPSGRVLSSMTVREGDYWATMHPDGHTEIRGDGVRVDLSCGRLDIWYGPRLLGPMFSPGSDDRS